MKAEMFHGIIDLEGGLANIPGDRGGVTYLGISSRAYPELKEEIASASLHPQEVRDIYLTDYYSKISGFRWLEREMPDLMFLLFEGRVHGTGDNHLTELIQRWLESEGYDLVIDGIWGPSTASAVRSLSESSRDDLMRAVYNSVDSLAERRAKSVGIDNIRSGIINRVNRAHNIAGSITSESPGTEISRLGMVDGDWLSFKLQGSTIWVKA